MVELGQKVKDRVTGFNGIAIARVEYLNGCVQILVRPKMVKPAKGDNLEYPNAIYIDVEELDAVGKKILSLNERKEPSGGVRQHPE